MADKSPEAEFLKAQEMEAAAQGYNIGTENTSGGAENEESDSDDYDPSAILQEDYSIPFDVQKESTASSVVPPMASEPLSAPNASMTTTTSNGPSTSIPQDDQVPSRPTSRLSAPQVSSTPVPLQTQSRTKGGFVVESDEEDAGDEQEEDNIDPYEPSDSADPTSLAGGVDEVANATIQAQPDLQVTNGASNGLSIPSASTPISSNTPDPSSISQAPKVVTSNPLPDHVSVAPKARLPNDVIGILEDRIKEDPRGDMDAWLSLIREHRDRNKQAEARNVYERFFQVFPSSVCIFLSYSSQSANTP